MKDFTFTADQVAEIIKTISELPAKVCYDTLKMIDINISNQSKQNEPKQ